MDILFRLLNEKEDGSFEVVGEELHKDGTIYHKSIKRDSFMSIRQIYTFDKDRPYLGNYIEHDRKDRLLVIYNGVKYFELDLLKVTMPQTFDYVTKEGHLYYDMEYGIVMIDFSNDGVSIPFWQPETEEWEINKLGILGVTP